MCNDEGGWLGENVSTKRASHFKKPLLTLSSTAGIPLVPRSFPVMWTVVNTESQLIFLSDMSGALLAKKDVKSKRRVLASSASHRPLQTVIGWGQPTHNTQQPKW